jgi:hypothetical protein
LPSIHTSSVILVPGVGAGDQAAQLARRVDIDAVGFEQHVAALARPRQIRRRPVRGHARHDDALSLGKPMPRAISSVIGSACIPR